RKIEAPPAVLRCGAHLPIDPDSALALQRCGREPTALHNNCSGKHVGMLSLARLLDAPLEGYLDPQHPAQRQIRGAIAQILERDGLAIKILDGEESDRARHVTVVEALLRLGWIQRRHLDGALGGYGPIIPVRNWAGLQVGVVRPSADFESLRPVTPAAPTAP